MKPTDELTMRWDDSQASLNEMCDFIKSNIKTAARSFIAIGYCLKQIRNGELYKQAGYATVWDFAKGELGISRSSATRYIAVNDRFSEDGNSLELSGEYQDYNQSQLIEMVTMTGEQLEGVSPSMTVRELREIKRPLLPENYQVEGQIDISKFLDDALVPAEGMATLPQKISFEMTLDELTCGESGAEASGLNEICATSHSIDLSAALMQQEISGTADGETEFLEADKRERAAEEPCENETDDTSGPEEPVEVELYRKDIMAQLISDAEETLEVMGEYWLEHNMGQYIKYRMMLQAYKDYQEKMEKEMEAEWED